MGRKLLALVAFVCLSVAGVSAQSLVIHGNGDPRTLTPVPNCASARFYVDDSTQKLYIAALGSPCTWTDSALAETAASYGPILNPMSGSTMFTYVAPASSSYRFCGFIGVVTGATTGTNSYMYVTFTQDGHSQTAINPTMGTPTPVLRSPGLRQVPR